MKITRKQIRNLILEYEQYVDEDGNVYDDEGNVSRRGKSFGSRYGGGTYGLNSPWSRRGSRTQSSRASSSRNSGGAKQAVAQIAALEAALEAKPSNFLQSILDQLSKGRSLSQKQKGVVKKILAKTAPESVSLFESHISKRQIRKIIKNTTK